jgi:tRNA pseudouridine38-40 synthase
MFRYKLIISYDGTNYYGWQIQPNKPTIASAIEDAAKSVFKKDIKIIGASRTDAGVHALGQVASFDFGSYIDPKILIDVLNSKLPKDILIRDISLADNFHPQKNVLYKIYNYYFSFERLLPILSRYSLYIYKRFDIDRLKEALNIFIGTKDFRSFTTGYDQENTIRTIDSIDINYISKFKLFQISIKGPGFLRYMIRRIVGASIHISSYSKDPNLLLKALKEKNPAQPFPTAPAYALVLRTIKYY